MLRHMGEKRSYAYSHTRARETAKGRLCRAWMALRPRYSANPGALGALGHTYNLERSPQPARGYKRRIASRGTMAYRATLSRSSGAEDERCTRGTANLVGGFVRSVRSIDAHSYHSCTFSTFAPIAARVRRTRAIRRNFQITKLHLQTLRTRKNEPPNRERLPLAALSVAKQLGRNFARTGVAGAFLPSSLARRVASYARRIIKRLVFSGEPTQPVYS